MFRTDRTVTNVCSLCNTLTLFSAEWRRMKWLWHRTGGNGYDTEQEEKEEMIMTQSRRERRKWRWIKLLRRRRGWRRGDDQSVNNLDDEDEEEETIKAIIITTKLKLKLTKKLMTKYWQKRWWSNIDKEGDDEMYYSDLCQDVYGLILLIWLEKGLRYYDEFRNMPLLMARVWSSWGGPVR